MAEPWAFKNAMRRHAASVTLIAVGLPPDRAGLTATSVCSLTAEPPQLLVCLNGNSRTAQRLQEERLFSVNILGDRHRELAERFSSAHAISSEDKFRSGEWSPGPAGTPLLIDAVASFECELASSYPVDTHIILIGRVLNLHAKSDASALIYRDGRYGGWTALSAPAKGAAIEA